jgi:hypothetical protein
MGAGWDQKLAQATVNEAEEKQQLPFQQGSCGTPMTTTVTTQTMGG